MYHCDIRNNSWSQQMKAGLGVKLSGGQNIRIRNTFFVHVDIEKYLAFWALGLSPSLSSKLYLCDKQGIRESLPPFCAGGDLHDHHGGIFLNSCFNIFIKAVYLKVLKDHPLVWLS